MHEFVPESDQDDSEQRKDAEEFIGYDLLLHADEPQHVAWMLRKHSSKLRSLPMVQRALRTCVALQTDDFNAFFIEFHAMTLLEQAASLRHLVRVWTRSLHMMNKSFPANRIAFRWKNSHAG
ncbi:unnamed protein product [Peronospora belbahrii]|uniref:SAC3/GANP/THP3 conserved domain-containing protein n=1 Tax=Peronospora belbahrii TaxID=622444 RepID=A0ABN8CPW5_9STRA|nr:unnamed protein product [Peronospora belbahrii]